MFFYFKNVFFNCSAKIESNISCSACSVIQFRFGFGSCLSALPRAYHFLCHKNSGISIPISNAGVSA